MQKMQNTQMASMSFEFSVICRMKNNPNEAKSSNLKLC